jgi:type IV secretion system protein VirB10
MSAGGDLPPLEGDTTRNEPGPSGAHAPNENVVAPARTAAHQVDPAQFTHESKLPPLRLEEPKTGLAKGPTVIALACVGSIIALATAFAFSPSRQTQKPAEPHADQPTVTQTVQLPDVIQDPPPATPPDAADGDAASGPFRRGAGGQGYRANDVGPAPDGSRRARLEMLREEREKALGSSLYANIEDPFTAEQRPIAGIGAGTQTSPDVAGAPRTGTPATATSSAGDQNLQGRKNDFLTQTDRSDGYLPNQIVRPRSPYEVKAGTIIPTVLVTGINSDLPGTILGQVRENVYDTVSGNYLLIPQGSKVLAAYDSMVAYGQERVLVCWQRLIRPDGTSLSLDCQPGVDLGGYAGFADTVDNHWWRVLTGVALGSVLAAGVVVPQGNVSGYVPTIGQGMAANAAGAVNQAGQQITNRALNIQPTIKVRPGFSVNVLVTKDLVIPPYRPEGVTR